MRSGHFGTGNREVDSPSVETAVLPRLPTYFAALVVALSLAACSSEDDPYDALSATEMQYVIPDSGDWSSGELCPGGGDCSGPITVDVIERYDWFRITAISLVDDDSGASTTVKLAIAEARSPKVVANGVLEVRVWGPDVDGVEEVLSGGFDVWVGVRPGNDYAAVFAAFDGKGRLAGIGNAAAGYFTVPVARLAAEADAPSGFAFLDPLMTS